MTRPGHEHCEAVIASLERQVAWCQEELCGAVAKAKERASGEGRVDWTVDPKTHTTNSSPEFLRLASEVAHLIQDEAHNLLSGRVESVAQLIMAQLAHKHGLAPRMLAPRMVEEERAGEMTRELCLWSKGELLPGGGNLWEYILFHLQDAITAHNAVEQEERLLLEAENTRLKQDLRALESNVYTLRGPQ